MTARIERLVTSGTFLLHPADAVLWKTVHDMRVPDFWGLIDGSPPTPPSTRPRPHHLDRD